MLLCEARIGCIVFAPVRQPYHPHFLSYEFTRPDVAAASGSNLPTDSEAPIDWAIHNTVACLSPMHALRVPGMNGKLTILTVWGCSSPLSLFLCEESRSPERWVEGIQG